MLKSSINVTIAHLDVFTLYFRTTRLYVILAQIYRQNSLTLLLYDNNNMYLSLPKQVQ